MSKREQIDKIKERERKMTVAVKYCGGCNPRYDRGAALEKLKKRYPDIKFEGLDTKKKYDRILMICGCERTCLQFREDMEFDNRIIVGSEEEMQEIRF